MNLIDQIAKPTEAATPEIPAMSPAQADSLSAGSKLISVAITTHMTLAATQLIATKSVVPKRNLATGVGSIALQSAPGLRGGEGDSHGAE